MGNGAGTDGAPKQAETTITVDQLLVSQAFVYELDEVLAHYDIRAQLHVKSGKVWRSNCRIFRVLDQAAEATAAVTGEPGGFEVNLGANKELTLRHLWTASLKLLPYLTSAQRPRTGGSRYFAPTILYLISSVDTNILNRDLGNTQGNLTSGEGLYEIAGIKIYKSNNIPFLGKYGVGTGATIENTDTTNEKNDYGDTTDFANSCGLIFRDAAACVEAIGPSVQTSGSDVLSCIK